MSSETHIKQGSNQGSSQTEKRILTFDDIFTKNSHVLCDNSFSSPENSDWYWDSVFPIHRFSRLDFISIEKQVEYRKAFLKILSHPKSLTVKGVSCEILTFVNLLSDKINFLLREEKRSIRRSGKRFRDYSENESVEKTMLKELYDLLHASYRQSKRSELTHRNNETYNFLERIVLSVTENTNARIDFEEVYHPIRRSKKAEDFHADEQLVAAALYLSLSEGKSCGILTRDSDIRRILYNTLSYLSYFKKPECKDILDSAKRRGIEVYYTIGISEAKLDYSSCEFNHKKNRKGIRPETLGVIESQINSPSPTH